MKTITVPSRAKMLNDVLKKARRNGLILQSAAGERFVLTSIKNWEGFDVGESNNFAQEVKLTVGNKKLMKFLFERRGQAKRIPLAKVKEQLGIS
jgi:hypothetical protein